MVGPGMFYKIHFMLVGFLALVTLEWSVFSVRPHVCLQITRLSAGVAALVTLVRLVRLFSRVLQHDVAFQLTGFYARILARTAPLWLFPCVFPHHVNSQIISLIARKLACCASVRLFSGVCIFVLLQVA